MGVVEWAKEILDENGYSTWQKANETERLYFEDESVLGMVSEYRSVQELLTGWEERQDAFLDDYSSQLAAPGQKEKVWNAYTVHLTVETVKESSEDDRGRIENELFDIEEDFRGTRKLARCGLERKADAAKALLPLIQLQHSVELRAEDYREELRSEIGDKFDKGFVELLADESPADDIATSLLGDRE